jgi:hypothetical protein
MKQIIAFELHQSFEHQAFRSFCEDIFEDYELEFISQYVGVIQLEVFQINRLATMKSHLEAGGIGLTVVIGYQHDVLLLSALAYAKVVATNEITYLADIILLEAYNQKHDLLLALHQKLTKISHENIISAKVFLESGCNALLASEALYVHRNTFTYRMNKFMDQSNMDLRDFHCARLFQLWLTLRKTLK